MHVAMSALGLNNIREVSYFVAAGSTIDICLVWHCLLNQKKILANDQRANDSQTSIGTFFESFDVKNFNKFH